MLNEMINEHLELMMATDFYMDIKQVFRVHYEDTAEGRDALFVDMKLPWDKTLRLCSTHLESRANPSSRPAQLACAAKYMHEADASILAGNLSATEIFDQTLHIDNKLKDAYLDVGRQEGDEDATASAIRMASLVSDLIIQPVLRQARRFSSGFATEEQPSFQTLQQHQRTRSAGETGNSGLEAVILEDEEDMRTSNTRSDTASLAARYATGLQLVDQASPERQESNSQEPAALPVLPSTPIPQRAEPAPRQSQVSSTRSGSEPRTQWRALGVSKDSTLPEDDGMGHLRRRILAIQAMDISQQLKAQLVHQVLTEGYTKSQVLPPTSPKLGSPTTNYTARTSSEPAGPLQQALKFLNPLGDGSGPLALPLSEEDLAPTYVPATRAEEDDDYIAEFGGRREVDDSGEPALGCEHYRRNVKLQCATCEKWYTCRFCHDAVEDHTLPRKETKNMLCMLCGCPQKASDTCVKCNESAAQYYCGVCKLWNDDPNKPIYHCNDCGLCRVGQGLGKDFFHCKCIERSIDCDCPICGEYMFSSPRPVVFMQCGHSIHRHCFNEHMNSSYKCPICNKSCVNMEYQFRNYDIAILTQPMPIEYRDARANISCNDCSAKSQTAYHWLGLKCTVCNSYNTVQLQLLHMPGGATNPAPPATTGPFDHGASQRNMAVDAARILREIRRTQAAESVGLLSRNDSDSSLMSSLTRLHNDAANSRRSNLATAQTSNHGILSTSAPAAAGITADDLASLTRAGRLDHLPGLSDDSEAEEDEELGTWGSDAEYLRRNFTSADEEETDDDNDDDDDEEYDDESSGDECGEEEEEEDEEDSYEIVLLGHR
ncbi:putative RING finger protein C2F3.16 [Naviculisporaceae sp. PSN 640]